MKLSDTLRRLADDMEGKPEGTGLLLCLDGEMRTLAILDKEGSAKLQPWFDRIMNMVHEHPDTVIEERKFQ